MFPNLELLRKTIICPIVYCQFPIDIPSNCGSHLRRRDGRFQRHCSTVNSPRSIAVSTDPSTNV